MMMKLIGGNISQLLTCLSEDGMQSRVEFMRLLHEKKSGRVQDTSTKLVVDKNFSKLPHDLPSPGIFFTPYFYEIKLPVFVQRRG